MTRSQGCVGSLAFRKGSHPLVGKGADGRLAQGNQRAETQKSLATPKVNGKSADNHYEFALLDVKFFRVFCDHIHAADFTTAAEYGPATRKCRRKFEQGLLGR